MDVPMWNIDFYPRSLALENNTLLIGVLVQNSAVQLSNLLFGRAIEFTIQK
jgi:hypothetical protein